MSKFGVAGQGRDPLAYQDTRLSVVPTVDSNRDPTVNDTQWPIQTIWRNSTTFKECMLVGFTGGQAIWRCFTDSDGSVLEIRADDGNLIQPLGGIIDIDGETVANATNAKPVFFNGATANTGKMQVQLGTTVSPTPGDNTNAGLLCANINQFDIDATSGMLSLKGDSTNPAMTKLDVDFNTAPGTGPVVPSNTGQISLFGNVVPNGTNLDGADPVPVATHSRAVNQSHIDVQLAAAVAATPGDPDDVGLSSYDNRYFNITGNGFVGIEERLLQEPAGTTLNLGFSYSSPTFTLHGSDGTALSATNPAWVVVPDNSTKGQKKVFEITSNYTFDDDSGTSDLTGNTFGTTAGTVWTQNMPFWLYFVINDSNDAVTPMIARYPSAYQAPGTIGKPSSAVADAELDFWAIDDSITVGDYDSNPCVAVGSFVMQKNDGANDDWTVQAVTNRYGIGRMNYGTAYTFAINQNGATARYLSSSNGGDTLPTFNTDSYAYAFLPGGFMYILYNTTNINNTPAGTGNIRLHTPMAVRDDSWKRGMAGFAFDDSSLSNNTVGGNISVNANAINYMIVRSYTAFGTATTALTPGTVANGDGNFSWNLMYRCHNA